MKKTELLFIRHGETTWNRAQRIQGHTDTPLSERGQAQAQCLLNRFASGVEGQLDGVYSSDLLRAAQTAAPIAQASGVPVQIRTDFRERHYGEFEGHDYETLKTRFPEGYQRWRTRDVDWSFGHGESLKVFQRRIVGALDSVLTAHAGQRIAIVTHGGVLDCVYRLATGLPLDAPRDWPILNASVNVVSALYDANGALTWTLGRWGDDSHLLGDDVVPMRRAATP